MAKRGNNEGSIYKRNDGRWTAAVSMDDGKRRYIYRKTRQEVATKLNKALQDKETGIPYVSERQTLGEYLKTWLEQSAKPTLRPRTFISYEELVRLHMIPTIGRVPLSKLTPQQVQKLINELIETYC